MKSRIPTVLGSILLAGSAMVFPAVADNYTVTLDADDRSDSATGRVILFFVADSMPGWQRVRPMSGPFFSNPQPIASVAVEDFAPGESISITGNTAAFPDSLDTLNGMVRVQAVLDADQTERSFAAGPGNMYSDVVEIELAADREDHIQLKLTHRINGPKMPADGSNLRWIELRSELLSSFYGRDVYHRAGIALPPVYDANDEKKWPVIYVIPGYGGRHTMARSYASMLRSRNIETLAPWAIHIALDPESPLGHHGFVDSPNHGPRGTALVKELIPYLESKFNLASKPEGRIVTGHSSGGWSSLWLQLHWPDVFGACWSSSPDPIDFTAFQMTNVYKDNNMYVQSDGSPTPSFRRMINIDGGTKVMMTVRQEGLMEHAIDPLGRSGQQWDAWEAMFSPSDEQTGLPRPMFNATTGAIDKVVVEHWKQFDMARLVREKWSHYGSIMTKRVRLACGELDSYYLNRAVKRMKTIVDQHAAEHDGPGYIHLQPMADHGNIINHMTARWNREMREYLDSSGFTQPKEKEPPQN